KEIDDGERERSASGGGGRGDGAAPSASVSGKNQHQLRKSLRNLEKSIAKLDESRKQLEAEMGNTADVDQAMKLHTQLESVKQELAEAEERWVEIQEELGEW
ncbi:MAG: ABC transporter ATP-binding protein, partial [Planctomycetaceae bacterium]